MTKIITRYFDSATKARDVKFELVYRQRITVRIVELYDDPTNLANLLIASRVVSKTARAYQDRMEANGGAVLLVRAGHRPLGVAKTTRETAAAMGAIRFAGLVEEVDIKDDRKLGLSILHHHPTVLTRPYDPDNNDRLITDWLFPTISRRKPFNASLLPTHARMAGWPLPLISRKKPYTRSLFPRHARMANFPIPLLSKRKPYTGSIFPRHMRMASFPIPLLTKRE